MFKLKLLDTKSTIPERATSGSAGYDISSIIETIIPAKSQKLINTGISIEIPNYCYARIAPRSGLAYKYSIDVMAGVIDSDYRGEIKVILYNHGTEDFVIKIGDKIAQLIFEKIELPDFILSNLNETQRNDKGFGSTS